MTRPSALKARAVLGGLVILMGYSVTSRGESIPDIGPTLAKAGVSAAAVPRAQAPVEIEISEFAFQTDTLRVSVGETVRWVNRDLAPHSVVPDAEDGAWGSGLIGPGESFERRFEAKGQYAYHCGPHPFMRAVIMVGEPKQSTVVAPAAR